MTRYAIRIKAEGDLLWFLAVGRRGSERLSLSHYHTLLGVRLANFSILGYELGLIKSDIERAAGEPARLVRLVLDGPQDWLTMRGREIIDATLREIEEEWLRRPRAHAGGA